jgi:spermidine/putrescine-binding protein
MTTRFLIGALAASFLAAALTPSPALAQKKKLEISQKWSGSVDDDKAAKPECIATAKGLEAVWKAWKAPGEVPTVDFTKNIVVAVYSSGSKLDFSSATLDDAGNLEVVGLGTRDLRPGFRYVLAVISKEGVKTVNKKALPEQ